MVLVPTDKRRYFTFCYLLTTLMMFGLWALGIVSFQERPFWALAYFGLMFWPASLYFLWIAIRSYPFNTFPNPHTKVFVQHKIKQGKSAKIEAALWFTAGLPFSCVPAILFWAYYFPTIHLNAIIGG
ncbi:hypothetical protein [Gilvimarinus algae]|uniref:Uncharacterized protein n=1 Tax=Gilvimarinus algae TaxID=3058037 RepID=A0ABT8TCU1_9GAMM|nr:hypothetical protein [Gilvimarinus sp. SDUM040014]MDO3381445.1 hypothetical protein [Gilvimarinus sp. SDUM040014]